MVDTNTVLISGIMSGEPTFDEEKRILKFKFRSFFCEAGFRNFVYFSVYMFGKRAEKNVGRLHINNPYIIKGRLSSFKDNIDHTNIIVIAEFIYKLDEDWYKEKSSESDDTIVPLE